MVVMMDLEISCKGHCEKLSHFLRLVSHTVQIFHIMEQSVCYFGVVHS